jgi:hypothetical protein
MHPDKFFAEIQAQIDNGTLRYSPEVIGAIQAHARAKRALEMSRLISRALNGLGARLAAAAAAFAKTPRPSTR